MWPRARSALLFSASQLNVVAGRRLASRATSIVTSHPWPRRTSTVGTIGPKPLSTASDKFLLSSDRPSWDQSPISRGPWYFSLEEYLPTVDARFPTLIRKGWVLDRGKVCVTTQMHLVTVRDGLNPPSTRTKRRARWIPYPLANLDAVIVCQHWACRRRHPNHQRRGPGTLSHLARKHRPTRPRNAHRHHFHHRRRPRVRASAREGRQLQRPQRAGARGQKGRIDCFTTRRCRGGNDECSP